MQPSLAVGDRLLVDKVRLTITKKTDILRVGTYTLAVTEAVRVHSSAGVK